MSAPSSPTKEMEDLSVSDKQENQAGDVQQGQKKESSGSGEGVEASSTPSPSAVTPAPAPAAESAPVPAAEPTSIPTANGNKTDDAEKPTGTASSGSPATVLARDMVDGSPASPQVIKSPPAIGGLGMKSPPTAPVRPGPSISGMGRGLASARSGLQAGMSGGGGSKLPPTLQAKIDVSPFEASACDYMRREEADASVVLFVAGHGD
jgi:hypothetical protein